MWITMTIKFPPFEKFVFYYKKAACAQVEFEYHFDTCESHHKCLGWGVECAIHLLLSLFGYAAGDEIEEYMNDIVFSQLSSVAQKYSGKDWEKHLPAFAFELYEEICAEMLEKLNNENVNEVD